MVHKAQHVTHGDQKVSGEEDSYDSGVWTGRRRGLPMCPLRGHHTELHKHMVHTCAGVVKYIHTCAVKYNPLTSLWLEAHKASVVETSSLRSLLEIVEWQ